MTKFNELKNKVSAFTEIYINILFVIFFTVLVLGLMPTAAYFLWGELAK